MIELVDISKTYLSGKNILYALRGVSLEIQKGEFVAIMGPSGSGKSTLMNIIGCLDRPTSGTYRLNKVRVDEMPDDALASVRNRSIGFVFQTFNLLPRHNAIENCELPLLYSGTKDAKERAERALSSVGLAERTLHMPNELSGGERQRVAIARAIVTEPDIILADEPTGNLDSKTGKEIMGIFAGLNAKGVTIVLVTHDREVASNARRTITIKDGRVEA